MKTKSTKDIQEVMVKIHGLSFFEGHGVGRSDDGKVYFVDLACPGDLVLVKPYKETNKFSFASIVKIIEASNDRVEAPCEVFGKCGGCSIQHVNYQKQIEQKQFVLERYHSKNSFFQLEPMEMAENTLHYRNRMEVHVEKRRWGLYKKKSHQLIHPKRCMIVDENINAHLSKPFREDGHYHINLKGVQKRTRGVEGVFDQVNPEINAKLKNYLFNLVDQNKDGIHDILDLFAGSGNYSLFLAPQLPHLNFTAVELSHHLIEKGKASADAELPITWVCSDVTDFLSKLEPSRLNNSLVVVNPPRDGLSKEFIQTLHSFKPRKIIYVSCNPMTLFRDIDALSPIWRLQTLKGFDMFPQTMHFESVALLSSN